MLPPKRIPRRQNLPLYMLQQIYKESSYMPFFLLFMPNLELKKPSLKCICLSFDGRYVRSSYICLQHNRVKIFEAKRAKKSSDMYIYIYMYIVKKQACQMIYKVGPKFFTLSCWIPVAVPVTPMSSL